MFKGLSLRKMFDYKKGNLAISLLAVFYLIFPIVSLGRIDTNLLIYGLMFLTISVMRAKESNAVVAGFIQALMGVVYVLAIAGLISSTYLMVFGVLLTAIFFAFELGLIKFGPITRKADAFQIVPFTLLSVGILLSLFGLSTLFQASFASFSWSTINFVAILMFSLFSSFQIAGWNLAKNNTNKFLIIFAFGAVATTILGTYQGVLWQWT